MFAWLGASLLAVWVAFGHGHVAQARAALAIADAAPPSPQKPTNTQRPGGTKPSKPAASAPAAKSAPATNKTSGDASAPANPAPAGGPAASAGPASTPGDAVAPARPSTGGAATTAPSAEPTRSLPAGIDASRRESELYGERLQRLESDVEELKEKVFRTRARLALLKETVLHGVMAGTRTIIAHRNLMGSQFRLVKIVYFLDGAQVFARSDDDGTLDSEEEIVIFDGNLVSGPHNVTLELTYRGRGSGLFSYLNGYVFESRSSHSFTASEDASLKLLSVGFEQGNLTTEMSDRPAVSWQELAIDAAGKPVGERRGRGRDRAAPPKAKATTKASGRAKRKKGS